MVRNAGFHVNHDISLLLENPMTFADTQSHEFGEIRDFILEIVEIATGIVGRVHIDEVDRLVRNPL
jgi:hypothetical protein